MLPLIGIRQIKMKNLSLNLAKTWRKIVAKLFPQNLPGDVVARYESGAGLLQRRMAFTTNDYVSWDVGVAEAGYFGPCTISARFILEGHTEAYSVIWSYGASAYRVYIQASNDELFLNASSTGIVLNQDQETFIEVDYDTDGAVTALRLDGVDQGVTVPASNPVTTEFHVGARQGGLKFNGSIWNLQITGDNGLYWPGTGPTDADWEDTLNPDVEGAWWAGGTVTTASPVIPESDDFTLRCKFVAGPISLLTGTGYIVGQRQVSASTLAFGVTTGGNFRVLAGGVNKTTSASCVEGQEYEVVITRVGDDFTFEVVGVETEYINSPGAIVGQATGFRIGTMAGYAYSGQTGVVRDVTIETDAGTVLDWTCDGSANENFIDNSGNGNNGSVSGSVFDAVNRTVGGWRRIANGTVNGNPTLATIPEWLDQGLTGERGMWFDGVDDHINLGASDPLGFDSRSKIEIDCYIYIDANPSGIADIISSTISGSSLGYGFDVQTNGTMRMAGRSVSTDTFQTFLSTATVPLGEYVRVRGYLDFVNEEAGISIDGGAFETGAMTFANDAYTYGSTSVETRIGSSEGASRYFPGLIRNLCVRFNDNGVYNRYPLDGTAASWGTDTVGSVDGTVDGSPAAAVRTKTGWRQANDLPATVEWEYGVDEKGRDCLKGSEDAYGVVDYVGGESTGGWVRAIVAKYDALSAGPFICDGPFSTARNIVSGRGSTGTFDFFTGSTWGTSSVSRDTDWHVFLLTSDGATVQSLWVDGALVGTTDSGADGIDGLSLMGKYDGTGLMDGKVAALIDLINVTDIPAAVAQLNDYFAGR